MKTLIIYIIGCLLLIIAIYANEHKVLRIVTFILGALLIIITLKVTNTK